MNTTTGTTVLRAAWLFDGSTPTLMPNPTVVVNGSVISAVGSSLPAPDGATVVDLPGVTLLPGLIDTHVHLAFDASADPVARLAERDAADTFTAMCAGARRATRGGVTTIRDLGDVAYLSLGVRAATQSDPTLPHIVAAGIPITTPGGHCHFLGEGVAGADALRAAVRARHERGVDVIKVMASGGNMTPGSRPELSQYTVDELRAIVDEAHGLGLPVTAHAHGTQAIADAVAAGVDSLEHATFMTADSVDDIPDGLLREIVDRGVALSMTFGIQPVDGARVPPAIAARLPRMIDNARRLYSAGARMVVGTDAGIAPVKPHDVLRTALPQLAQLGMSPAEALHAITGRAAEVIGLGHRKGRLVPGYDADILAIDGNPLDRPETIHCIKAVYLRGLSVVRP